MTLRNYDGQVNRAGSVLKRTYPPTALIILLLLGVAGVGRAAAQTIASLSSSSLAQAGRLKIIGSGFGTTQGSSLVTIGGATAPVSSWSSTSVTAYVSDSSPLGVDQVEILTSGGGSNMVKMGAEEAAPA